MRNFNSGAALAALLSAASVQAQAPTPMQQSSVVLGGPATTITIAGVVPYTYYSATVPGFPEPSQTSIVSGAIATPTSTLTYAFTESGGAVTTVTESLYGYYTVTGGTTYSLNDMVPLSVWAPGNYPCPSGFLNRGNGCVFCPTGFYWDRTSCVPDTDPNEPLVCNDGYITTNGANGASSCVTTTTMTSAIPTDNCPNGYSTVVDTSLMRSDCVYGTNVIGGPPPGTLGGPASTITTAGFTVTEYSAALLQGGIEDYTTLTGSPTATITVGGGFTTFGTLVGSLLTVSLYGSPRTYLDSLSTYSTVLTTESLGMVTITQYDSAVLPVPYADYLATSVASVTAASSSSGVGAVALSGSGSGSGSSSVLTSSAMPVSSASAMSSSVSAMSSPASAMSSSPSSMPGAIATSGMSSSTMSTTTTGSTVVSGTSAAASASATPYKGGAGSGNVDSTLAGLSMIGALLVALLVSM